MVDVDDVTNKLLDDALEEKRRSMCYYSSTTASSRISTTCVNRLRRRMELDPSLRYLDAVRMIGLNNVNDIDVGDEDDIDNIDNNIINNNNDELYVKVDEIDDLGLFEARATLLSEAAEEEESYYQPTTNALQFGRQVQQLFFLHNYKYQTCRDRYLLIPQLSDDDDRDQSQNQNQNHLLLLLEQNHHRIYSGQSFFAHRHELFETKRKVRRQQQQRQRKQMNHARDHDDLDDHDSPDFDDFTTPFDVLVWLFLFGLGLELSVVVKVLGQDNVDLLMNAHLLDQFCLNDPKVETIDDDEDDEVDGDGCREKGTTTATYLVGRVQIYPIDIEMFIPSPLPPRASSPNEQELTEYSTKDQQQQELCHNSPHDNKRHLLIATDWPMESLRSTRNAIMSIGYDTLELFVLTGGAVSAVAKSKVSFPHPEHGDEEEESPHSDHEVQHNHPDPLIATSTSDFDVLDLCCGCGIQGIFVWKVWKYHNERRKMIKDLKMTFSDLNRRAMNFITANIAPNGLLLDDDQQQQGHQPNPQRRRYQIFCGNLFESIPATVAATPEDSSTTDRISHRCNQFDWILCNPPFVAVPPDAETTQQDESGIVHQDSSNSAYPTPALFAVGGGVDGMDLLRKIMKEIPHYMKTKQSSKSHRRITSSHHPRLFMVTEVPNVDQSCRMLKRMLLSASGSTNNGNNNKCDIRVAYVEEDVETVEEYCKERQEEAGLNISMLTGTTTEPNQEKEQQQQQQQEHQHLASPTTFYGYHDWSKPMHFDGIYNRALVLISITFLSASFDTKIGTEVEDEACESLDETTTNDDDDNSSMFLFSYSSKNETATAAVADAEQPLSTEELEVDEEDAFLTPDGMEFIRRSFMS